MSRYGMIGDKDNSAEIQNGMINIPATAKSYETVVRKFRAYVGVDVNERVLAEALNDYNFSNFLLEVGKEHDWKPHFKNSTMAAMGSMLKREDLDLIFDRHDLFRETHRVIMHWLCQLKITPYHTEGSTPYSAASLGAMLQLACTTPSDLRDSACVVLTCFTALRIEDVEGIRERMLTVKLANKTLPHRIIIVLDKTKNDKTGTGPTAGRTFGLPCTCHLDMDVEETAAFAKQCKGAPKTRCPDLCPYQIVMDYQAAKPTALVASSKGAVVALGEMAFGRAVAARGEVRNLTTYKLGMKEMRKCVNRVDARLPEDNHIARPTGHSGRTTLVTVAVNEGGVDPTLVAQASKHRDPKTCMSYIRPDETTLVAAAIGVGRAVRGAVADEASPAQAKPPKAMANKRFLVTDPESNDEDEEDEEKEEPNIPTIKTRKINKHHDLPQLEYRGPAATAAAAAISAATVGASSASYTFNYNF
ncbi:hypothetical protein B484DRAFT_408063 [Ochromonadaceae sp. CCMP2298]|nr:hypothetical protein B484DRAFT_408063 [Ochromonadaceae sp. CCMP2298]